MVEHRIQIMTSADVDVQKVQTKIDDLKSKYGEALTRENRDLTRSQTLDGSVTYYLSTFIIQLSPDSKTTEKNDLLEQIEKEADKYASWRQSRWHACNHDENLSAQIKSVDASTDSITVEGDVNPPLSSGNEFRIVRDGSNNGTYTVSSLSYDSANDETTISVSSDIVSSEKLGRVTGTGCSWNYLNKNGTIPAEVEW